MKGVKLRGLRVLAFDADRPLPALSHSMARAMQRESAAVLLEVLAAYVN